MTDLTDYTEGMIIDHIFRSATWAKPSALYVGLFTTSSSDAAAGTEVSGGSYARAQLDPSDANWAAPAAGDGHTENSAALTFPAPTADWGQVTHWGLFDAASGGNMIIQRALNTSKTINNGDAAPSFGIGDLDFTID